MRNTRSKLATILDVVTLVGQVIYTVMFYVGAVVIAALWAGAK